MHAPFFALKQDPFSTDPDPRFLFMSKAHRGALAYLLDGLQRGGGLRLLHGARGAGKSTVCRCLFEQVPRRCNVAYLAEPPIAIEDLLRAVCDAFGIPYRKAASGPAGLADCVEELQAFLLRTRSVGLTNVLVVDEAQRLTPEAIDGLRAIAAQKAAGADLLQVVLVGDAELPALLASAGVAARDERGRFHLKGLSAAETRRYVAHRLAVAGLGSGSPFDRRALARVHALSRGIPRRIDLLCDRALRAAFAAGSGRVEAAGIDRAAAEVFGRSEAIVPSHRKLRFGALVTGISLVAGGAVYAGWRLSADGTAGPTSTMMARASTAGSEPGSDQGNDASANGPASGAEAAPVAGGFAGDRRPLALRGRVDPDASAAPPVVAPLMAEPGTVGSASPGPGGARKSPWAVPGLSATALGAAPESALGTQAQWGPGARAQAAPLAAAPMQPQDVGSGASQSRGSDAVRRQEAVETPTERSRAAPVPAFGGAEARPEPSGMDPMRQGDGTRPHSEQSEVDPVPEADGAQAQPALGGAAPGPRQTGASSRQTRGSPRTEAALVAPQSPATPHPRTASTLPGAPPIGRSWSTALDAAPDEAQIRAGSDRSPPRVAGTTVSTRTEPSPWQGPRSEDDAWRELASLWNLPLAAGDPCEAVKRQRLHCYKRKGTLQSLRNFEGPVVLTLRERTEGTAYAVLTGFAPNGGPILRVRGVSQTISPAALALVWNGEFGGFEASRPTPAR
ncbi:MAG: AAA family ATPase [Rhizobacter sp.]